VRSPKPKPKKYLKLMNSKKVIVVTKSGFKTYKLKNQTENFTILLVLVLVLGVRAGVC
jgi:hypothetical protein